MALILTQRVTGGFEAEYWVAEPHANKRTNTTAVNMLLFKDQAAREAGADPVARERIDREIPGCYHTGVEVYAFVIESVMDMDGQEMNKFVAAIDAV